MRRGLVDRKYLYEREGHQCYHCGKQLKPNQVSVDHYLPKCAGGSNDLYNLVCSCKRCNRYKKSAIPDDWKAVHIRLFQRLIADRKIGIVGGKVEWDKMAKEASTIRNIEQMGSYTIFLGEHKRFYVKQGKIWKIE